MLTQLRPALTSFAALTLITGLAYPLLTTGVAQVLFPAQANGSLVEHHGKPVGSALLGQSFNSPQYFWSRPSATSPDAYNAAASSGSNLGPSHPDLAKTVGERIQKLRAAGADPQRAVPVDLVTASASGLDPEISAAAAHYQVQRVAQARQRPQAEIEALVAQHTQHRLLGVFGEPRANVLALNLALDEKH